MKLVLSLTSLAALFVGLAAIAVDSTVGPPRENNYLPIGSHVYVSLYASRTEYEKAVIYGRKSPRERGEYNKYLKTHYRKVEVVSSTKDGTIVVRLLGRRLYDAGFPKVFFEGDTERLARPWGCTLDSSPGGPYCVGDILFDVESGLSGDVVAILPPVEDEGDDPRSPRSNSFYLKAKGQVVILENKENRKIWAVPISQVEIR